MLKELIRELIQSNFRLFDTIMSLILSHKRSRLLKYISPSDTFAFKFDRLEAKLRAERYHTLVTRGGKEKSLASDSESTTRGRMSRVLTRCDNLRLIGRAYRYAARWLRERGEGDQAS